MKPYGMITMILIGLWFEFILWFTDKHRRHAEKLWKEHQNKKDL